MADSYLGKILDLKKPDGTPMIESPVTSSIIVGTAAAITKLATSKATDVLRNGASSIIADTKTTAGTAVKNTPLVSKNPMEQFASVTVLWTMACLTPSQFNNPTSYRNNPQDLSNVVFSSGGRMDSQRTRTLYGTPEYFINNFQMNCIIGTNEKTGNSNAIKFSFDVYEPYSLGILLQSMQAAAINAGYLSYLDNAPYVLRMDIQGYNELGQTIKSIKPKFFVLKLTSMKFNVTEVGSNYKVEAIPYNHQGFANAVNVAYNDLKLVADTNGPVTVVDLLSTGKHSLAAALNDVEKRLKKEQLIGICDEYYIEFPVISGVMYSNAGSAATASSATVSTTAVLAQIIGGNASNVVDPSTNPVNSIGTAGLGFDATTGGSAPFKRAQDQIDPKTGVVKRDGMTINPKLRVFQFAQGATITSIINQIVLSSDYASKAIDPKLMKAEVGYISWFKLDVQIQLLAFDPLVGDYAKKIIYRVVPYFVHQSIFANPSAAPVGYAELQKLIAKEYQYIYTGQNVDILKFDISINNLFYAGVNPSPEKDASTTGNKDQGGTAESTIATTKSGQGPAVAAQATQTGRAKIKRDPGLLAGYKGGASTTTVAQNVAHNFQNAFISGNSADMVTLDLEILGDPYWLIDSGISNYFASVSSQKSQITNDGTMNYESGNIYIYITFKTPVDVNELTGLYDFPAAGKESPFGGIYRVSMCENTFNDGMWTQKLKCLRMPGPQGPEINKIIKSAGPIVISKTDSSAREIGPAAPLPSSNIDNSTGNSKIQAPSIATATTATAASQASGPTTTTSNQARTVVGFRYYRDLGKQ